MRETWFVIALAALTGTAFSGCVAEADAAETAAPPASAAPVEFDSDTGGVEGLVTDEEINPVVGAQVGILKSDAVESDMVTRTDASGRFSLSRVPPGTHRVFVQALGYEAQGRNLEVVAGAVVTWNVALNKLPSDEPFHITDLRKAAVTALMVKLTPSCIYNIGNQGTLAKTCQGTRISCDPGPNCEVHYTSLLEKQQEAGNNWTTVIGEVTWGSQSAATGKGFMFDITAPNTPRGAGGSIDQGSPYTFFRMQPKPPIIWRIEPALLIERKIPESDWCCDWFYRLFGGWCDIESTAGLNNCETIPDVGISNENAATIYMTWFFKEPAPPTFTALQDA